MRDLSKKEMDEKLCKECTNCKRSGGVYYCTKGHCPYTTEDYNHYKEVEKK